MVLLTIFGLGFMAELVCFGVGFGLVVEVFYLVCLGRHGMYTIPTKIYQTDWYLLWFLGLFWDLYIGIWYGFGVGF